MILRILPLILTALSIYLRVFEPWSHRVKHKGYKIQRREATFFFQCTRFTKGGARRIASAGQAATQLPSYQHSLPKTAYGGLPVSLFGKKRSDGQTSTQRLHPIHSPASILTGLCEVFSGVTGHVLGLFMLSPCRTSSCGSRNFQLGFLHNREATSLSPAFLHGSQ